MEGIGSGLGDFGVHPVGRETGEVDRGAFLVRDDCGVQ